MRYQYTGLSSFLGVLCIVSSSHPAGFMSYGGGMGKTGLSGI